MLQWVYVPEKLIQTQGEAGVVREGNEGKMHGNELGKAPAESREKVPGTVDTNRLRSNQ